MKTDSYSNRRIITAFIMILVMLMSFTVNASADSSIKLEAESAILIDADSGVTLYEKNADERRAPASMTKMMTAILAVENLDLEDTVKISRHVTTIEGSAVGLKKNEVVKVKDLLGAMLVYSANDCATALGEAVSGDEKSFAKLMTKRAEELGCTNTTFKNACGLDCKGHMSTARDMAIIGQYAVKNEIIAGIVKKTSYTMAKTNKRSAVTLGSTDRLLFDGYSWITVNGKSRHPYYQYACGIKTGFTDNAGGCLASLAVKDGKRIISVVMKSTDMKRFQDAIKLLDYGFENYDKKVIFKKNEKLGEARIKYGKDSTIDVVAKEGFSVLVNNDSNEIRKKVKVKDDIKAPVSKGDKLGNVEIYMNGEKVGETAILASSDVEQNFIGKLLDNKIAVYGILITLLAVIIAVIIKRKKER